MLIAISDPSNVPRTNGGRSVTTGRLRHRSGDPSPQQREWGTRRWGPGNRPSSSIDAHRRQFLSVTLRASSVSRPEHLFGLDAQRPPGAARDGRRRTSVGDDVAGHGWQGAAGDHGRLRRRDLPSGLAAAGPPGPARTEPAGWPNAGGVAEWLTSALPAGPRTHGVHLEVGTEERVLREPTRRVRDALLDRGDLRRVPGVPRRARPGLLAGRSGPGAGTPAGRRPGRCAVSRPATVADQVNRRVPSRAARDRLGTVVPCATQVPACTRSRAGTGGDAR